MARGVIHRVADIVGGVRELEQAFGMRLVLLDIFHADHGGEGQPGREAVERDRGIRLRTARKHGEIILAGEFFQGPRARHPLFAKNQPIIGAAQEDRLEVVLHLLEGNAAALSTADVMREFPIVVPAALILVFLNLLAPQLDAGEMFDGLRDAFAIALGNVHQDAVHIENDEWFGHWLQISSSAVSRRRVCSRVPTVMRTHPAAS